MDRAAGLALARELGWLMAAELRAVGVDMSFAPCVDLDYGVSSVIGDRALHADAGAVGELAVAYMLGMRDAGMAATAKHFPGHGAVAADSHVASPVDRREWPDVEADFGPYRRLIANGLPAVMVAHVVFPAIDAHPASLSRHWVREILRGDLGFQGAVFADDLSMAGAAAFGDIVARARLARGAGCDVLPVCNDRAAALALLDAMRHRAGSGRARCASRGCMAGTRARRRSIATRAGKVPSRPRAASSIGRRSNSRATGPPEGNLSTQPPSSSSSESAAAIRAAASAASRRSRRREGPSSR